MFGNLSLKTLFASSQVKQLLDQATLTEIAEVNSGVSSLGPDYDYPGDLCCRFYTQFDYHSSSLRMCVYEDEPFTRLDLHVDHASSSSWYCGKDVAYNFCFFDSPMECNSNLGYSGAGHSSNSKFSIESHPYSSFYLERYIPQEKGSVILFEGTDCTGKQARFYDDATSGRAQYDDYSLAMRLLYPGTPSSIMIPEGHSVELYHGAKFDLKSKTMVGSPYTDDRQQMQCQNLDDIKVNSFIVVKQ